MLQSTERDEVRGELRAAQRDDKAVQRQVRTK